MISEKSAIKTDDEIMFCSKRHSDLGVYAILISAILVRIFLFKSTFRPEILDRFFYNYLIFPKYSWIANKIIAKAPIGRRILDFSPLYTCLITIFYKFFSDQYLYYKIFQIMIGALNCVLVYKISDLLFNNRIAVIAGLIAIFYKPLILYEFILEPVTLIIFLNLISVYLLLYASNKEKSYEHQSVPRSPLQELSREKGSWRFFLIWFLPGLTMGLSFDTRPNILIFFFIAILWIIFKKDFKAGELRVALFSVLLGFFLMTSPVMIRNYRYSKRILKPMMSSGQVFYQGNNPMSQGFYGSHPYLVKEMEMDTHINPEEEPDFAHEIYRRFAEGALKSISTGALQGSVAHQTIQSSQDEISSSQTGKEFRDMGRFWFQRSLNFIKAFPLRYIQLLSKKIRYFWGHYEIHDILQVYYLDWEMDLFPLFTFGLIIPFSLLGIVLSIRAIKRYILLYAMVANYFISNLIFFVTSRQRLPALPFLIPFAAFALYMVIIYLAHFFHCYVVSWLSLFKKKSDQQVIGSPLRRIQSFVPFLTGVLLLFFLFKIINIPSIPMEHFEIMLHLNHDSQSDLKDASHFMNNQEFVKAKKAFQSAYNLFPFHQTRVPNPFLGGNEKKYEEGIRFWERVLDNKHDNDYARFNLGYLGFLNGDYDTAIDEFRTLVKNNTQGFYGYSLPIGEPLYYIAKSFEKKGEWENALHEYEKLQEAYPGLPWVMTSLIALYEHTGENKKAVAVARILEKLDNPISSSYLLSEAYYEIGAYEKALSVLKSIDSAFLDRYAPFHFLLSACYAGLGTKGLPLDSKSRSEMLELAVKECGIGMRLRPKAQPPDTDNVLEAGKSLSRVIRVYGSRAWGTIRTEY
ncbi:MAG: tetratricopeptide repeat protein, partial [bacterium]